MTTSPKKKEYDRAWRYREGKICPICGVPITNTASRCNKCAAKKRYWERRKAWEEINDEK